MGFESSERAHLLEKISFARLPSLGDRYGSPPPLGERLNIKAHRMPSDRIAESAGGAKRAS